MTSDTPEEPCRMGPMPPVADPKRRTYVALAALIAAVFFGLGLFAAGLLNERENAEHTPREEPSSAHDSRSGAPRISLERPTNDAGGPTIVFDPSTIQLLPDASLHLTLPEAFDAGPDDRDAGSAP